MKVAAGYDDLDQYSNTDDDVEIYNLEQDIAGEEGFQSVVSARVQDFVEDQRKFDHSVGVLENGSELQAIS